jgi:transcriptional regulator with XRE-family HTH domain
MKTIKDIREQLGVTKKDMAAYLEMPEKNYLSVEEGSGKLQRKSLGLLKQLESWLNGKPKVSEDEPSVACINHCQSEIVRARYKKFILEQQLSPMEERYQQLDAEHTALIKISMQNVVPYVASSLENKRFKLERQMTTCCGERQSELRMKIHLLSEQIKSLTTYLGT